MKSMAVAVLTLLVVVLTSVGLATTFDKIEVREPGKESCVGGQGVFTGMNLRGPVMYWCSNPSSTDTIETGEVVGFTPASVTVVTLYAVGNVMDTSTIASAITTTLDTLFDVPRASFEAGPNYDSARLGRYYLRVRLASPGCTSGDVFYVYIHGYDNQGQPQWLRWTKTSGATTATVYDTILTMFALAKVDTVYVRARHATDSLGVYAHAVFGVKVATDLGTAADSESYAGVAQGKIYPRHRGPVQRAGPNAKVKIDASSADIKNGYWLTPSGTSGYAIASASIPLMPIGRVTQYSQANGVAVAMLEEPFTTLGVGFDSLSGLSAAAESIADVALDTAQAALHMAVDTATVDSIAASYSPSVIYADFRAGQFIIPQTGGPALLQSDSTNTSWFSLAYDGTTEENAYVFTAMKGYSLSTYADSIGVRIYWTADTAGLDTVRWVVDISLRSDGQLLDSALNLGGFMLDVNTGRGKLNVCSANFTLTGAGANKLIDLGIGRNPSAGDNMTRDAELVLATLTYYTHVGGEQQ